MPSIGMSIDSAINGLTAGVDQARKVASQLSRDPDSQRPTAASAASETSEASEVGVIEFEQDESVGTNIDVSV